MIQLTNVFFFCILFLIASFSTLFAQWTFLTNSPITRQPTSFAVLGTNLFAGGIATNGVFISTDNGDSWKYLNLDERVQALTVSGNTLFAGTELNGIFRSTDNGESWQQINTGLTNSNVLSIAATGSNIFAGTSGGGVFLSTDNGESWTQVSTGLTNLIVNALAILGSNLFAGTDAGAFLSTNNGTSWTKVSWSAPSVKAFAVLGNTLFMGHYGGIQLTSDNGTTWKDVTYGLKNVSVRSLAVSGTNLFAGTWSGGVFLTTNNGATWTDVSTGLTNLFIQSLGVSDSYIFAGIPRGGVWRRSLSEMITSVENTSADIPTQFDLEQNDPNPFEATTSITFTLPAGSFVELKIFDALGREVSRLLSEQLPPGVHTKQWDASALPSGVYHCSLRAGTLLQTKKLVLVR